MRESVENRDIVTGDLQFLDAEFVNYRLNAAKLDDTPLVNGRYAFTFEQKPICCIYAFTNTAWLSARGGGSIAMLPHGTVTGYSLTQFYADEVEAQLQVLFDALPEFDALTHLHADMSIRSLEEKSRLLLAMNRIDGMLRHMRTTVTSFGACNELAIHGEDFSPRWLQDYQEPLPSGPVLLIRSPPPSTTSPDMLDVHPPHHAANSWRDFFIHIATIVVGLLIAVGLEQAVDRSTQAL